ncbi:unnamed protein product [Ectocarpus sp. 12 AP-2014]
MMVGTRSTKCASARRCFCGSCFRFDLLHESLSYLRFLFFSFFSGLLFHLSMNSCFPRWRSWRGNEVLKVVHVGYIVIVTCVSMWQLEWGGVREAEFQSRWSAEAA